MHWGKRQMEVCVWVASYWSTQRINEYQEREDVCSRNVGLGKEMGTQMTRVYASYPCRHDHPPSWRRGGHRGQETATVLCLAQAGSG